jgi:uncharacterized RDD family membrane protein YckC
MNTIIGNFKRASFLKRFAAFYLALFFISFATAFIVLLMHELRIWDLEFNTYRFWLVTILVFFILTFTDTFFQNILGANLAKRLLGLKIVDRDSENKLGLFRSLLRAIVGVFSFLFFGLGFIAIAFNKEALSLHDLISGSKVLEKQRPPILNTFTNLIAGTSFLVGTIFLFVFVASLAVAPLSLAKSFYAMAQYPKYDLSYFSKNKVFSAKINNDKVFVFFYSRHAEFIDFELDPSQARSSIAKQDLTKLGLNLTDLYFVLNNLGSGLSELRVESAYLAKDILLKDLNSKDLLLHDFSFVVDEKSIIGSDLLSIFDFSIDKRKNIFSLKPYRGDSLVLANPSYDELAQQYLIYMQRKIRSDWRSLLRQSDPQLLAQLSGLDKGLKNTVQINIDTQTGYVIKAVLLEPSKNEDFDKLCEQFLSSLERMRMMPDSLMEIKSISLEMDLVYQELI